jgi:hypothetical protein
MPRVRAAFHWDGDHDELDRLLEPLAEAIKKQNHPEPDIDVDSVIVITADYLSINAARGIARPWIRAWGGDEWGESMESLYEAGHTSHGLDDDDCARVTRILWKNLQAQKEWMDAEGHSYGLNEDEDRERAEEEAREARDYWLKGGNLGEDSRGEAKVTIDSIPKWVFGDA